MNRQDVIAVLRQHADALRSKGVRHAALFGSVARGDNRPDSDIDILVEFDPSARVTIFDHVGLKNYIAALSEEPVDVVDREALKPHLRRPSVRDAVYAFCCRTSGSARHSASHRSGSAVHSQARL